MASHYLYFIVIFVTSCNFPCVLAQDSKPENPCVKLLTCSECIQNPECAWCPHNEFLNTGKQRNSPKCDYATDHARCSAAQKDPFAHTNDVVADRTGWTGPGNSGTNFLEPAGFSLKLRVKDPVNISLTYKNVEGYPLELYYLMDGTLSMADDKEFLANLEDSLANTLRSMTSNYKQGFGTFVDKPTMPFASRLPRGDTCITKSNTTCIPPYSFRNRISITNDTSKFSGEMRTLDLSASGDFAEGGLDALMQVMVCENELGWSKGVRRMIIFATDSIFHFAGDGRLGGIYVPNDGICHLDSTGEYTHSTLLDYPSFAQINSKAKKHSVRIIFAATSESSGHYALLADSIEGAVTAELKSDSSNIVNLVKETYQNITSSVELKDTFPYEYFRVSYFSSCGSQDAEVATSTCDVQKGEVRFRVEIELLKCPPKEEWKRSYTIYPVGISYGVELNVEALCSCPCEDIENHIPGSPYCNRVGKEVCGMCECYESRYGDQCQCSSTSKMGKTDESMACIIDNTTEACSGRGDCICGQCVCSEQRYTGSYCECDNESCLKENDKLCAGNGVCKCGTCSCSEGWTGESCGCSTNKETCIEPGTNKECNGEGECKCGKCVCNSRFRGDFCEKCRVDSCRLCETLQHCVQCKLFQTGTLDSTRCSTECVQYDISKVRLVDTSTGDTNILCKVKDPVDDCVILFSYEQSGQRPLKITGQTTKECPPTPPIYWIIFAVSSFVVVVGIVIFCVFKFLRRIQIKREYAKYKKDVDNLDWKSRQENPLYHDPIGTFQNPTYRGDVSVPVSEPSPDQQAQNKEKRKEQES